MRIVLLFAFLAVAPLSIAQSNLPVWKKGPQETMCGLGTYHDALDLGFNKATSGFGETLVAVQVLPSFQTEHALIFKRIGTELKLYRATFQNQLWQQLGPPLHVRRTREQCLELAASAKVDALSVDADAKDLQELWMAFGNVNLNTDTCPRRGRSCAYVEDGTDYVVEIQDGRSFRVSETGKRKGVRSENPALLAWVNRLQQLGAASKAR